MSWIWLLSFFLQDSIWVFFRRCVMFASPIALSGRWRCLTVLRKNSELVTASVTRHNLRWNSILIGLQLLLIWNRTTDESTCTKAECTQQRKAICPFCYRSYFLGIFRIRGRKKKKYKQQFIPDRWGDFRCLGNKSSAWWQTRTEK